MSNFNTIFSRDSAGVQIKGGDYKLCEINEPRFSDKGLLIESTKTNKCPFSNKLTVTGSAGTTAEVTIRGFPLVACTRVPTAGGDFRSEFTFNNQQAAHVFSFISNTRAPLFKLQLTKPGESMREIARGPVTSLGNTLYRCSTVIPAGYLNSDTGWTLSALFNTTQGNTLQIGCLQLEAGPISTSPIPTDGGPVTRARDYFQIKGLPTTGRSVYHFHWAGQNTLHGRFEILAYENPSRRDKYRLVRLWQTEASENPTRNKQLVVWNTLHKTGSESLTDDLVVDVRGNNGTEYTMFVNNTSGSNVLISEDYTHGQITFRGTIDIPGDDPENETYIYHIKDFKVYDRSLTEEEMSKIDTAEAPANSLLHVPLANDVSATHRGFAWVPKFSGTSFMTVPSWRPTGGDPDFRDFELDITFRLASLTTHQYLFDSRPEGLGYCKYNPATKKLEHNLSGVCTVNGVTASDFIFEDEGASYLVSFSKAMFQGIVITKAGAKFDNSEGLDGRILSMRLRDMQYNVEDIPGIANKSRYYDFVQWTATETAPASHSIGDSWNVGKNEGTLTNCTWVRV